MQVQLDVHNNNAGALQFIGYKMNYENHSLQLRNIQFRSYIWIIPYQLQSLSVEKSYSPFLYFSQTLGI